MDATAYSEGKYLTKDLVKNSPTKIATILNEAVAIKGQFGNQLTCEVEMDKKNKTWNLTIDQVKSMCQHFGTDSLSWIGKQVQFIVVPNGAKEKLMVVPKL